MARKPKHDELTTAEKKVKFIKDFRNYLIMSIFFVALNLFGGSGHFWAIYPIAGWGLGIAFEYFSLYGPLKDPEVDEFDLDYKRPDRRKRESVQETRGYREEDLV